MDAYESAIQYYSATASTYDGKEAGLTALRYLSNCYLEQKRWREAVEVLGEILEKYSSSGFLNVKSADTVIKTINVVSAYQLKDYDVAVGIYRKIIDASPDHPLNGYLKKMIDAFNQLKEKGVQVSPKK